MSRPQIQPLSETAIPAVTDELVARVPELADATFVRPWAINTIVTASSGVIAGHRSFSTVSVAAQAVVYVTFRVKPLSPGSTAPGALFVHILLTTNGEEVSLAEI